MYLSLNCEQAYFYAYVPFYVGLQFLLTKKEKNVFDQFCFKNNSLIKFHIINYIEKKTEFNIYLERKN